MTVVKKAKENPLATIAVTVVALAAGFTGVWTGIGLVDRLHTTEAELLLYDLKAHTFASNQFDEITEQILGIEIIGKCRWLKSEIRALEDAIYVRKRDSADPDFINSLESDLKDLNEDYDALSCALKLA